MTDTNHNDSNHAASPDDQYPTNESSTHHFAPGEIGVGKTTRLAEWRATVSDHETEPVWFDPKGDTDGQDLDVSSINPLDVARLDTDGHDDGGSDS